MRNEKQKGIIQAEILELLKESEVPLSTRQFVTKLGYSWNTIQRHCMELSLQQRVERLTIPSGNLWTSVGSFRKNTMENNL
jgi:hypothetical protein